MDPTTQKPEWNEDDFVTALAKLEDLQNQLSSIRLIPRQLLASLAAREKNPTLLFQRFSKSVSQGTQSIDQLRTSWDDDQARKVFLHCQDSVNKDSNLAGGKDVPLWGWIQKAEKLQRIDDLETQSDEESPDAVIESLKKEFESLEWTDPGHKKLEVRLKGRASNMLFQISGRDTKIGAIYDCISVGASKENQALSKALRERKSQLNLRYLLEMLASYTNFRTEPCKKCSKLLDRTGSLPVVRKPEQKHNDTIGATQKWISFHQDCQ